MGFYRNKNGKKLISIILSLLMIFSVVPLGVISFAEEEETETEISVMLPEGYEMTDESIDIGEATYRYVVKTDDENDGCWINENGDIVTVVTFACPDNESSVVYAVADGEGSVVLPSDDEYTYVFSFNNGSFDGTGVTEDITVDMHCYRTDGVSPEGEPCKKEYKCIYCDKELADAVSTHDYMITEAVDGDCENYGYTEYLCTVCDCKKTVAETELGNHVYGETEYVWSDDDSVCVATRICTVNGSHIETENASVSYETTATCYSEGIKTYTAVFANSAFETQTKAVPDEIHHNMVLIPAEDPTCTEVGHTAGTKCVDCDAIGVQPVEIPAKGHSEVTVDGVDATCTKTGLTEGVVCSECGEVLTEQQEIPVKAHSYEAVVTEPTCTKEGYTTYTCSECGDTYVDDTTEAKGHSYGEWIIEKEPTCTEEGKRIRYCSEMDDFIIETIVMKEHNYEATVTQPTCTEDGYTTYVCADCGTDYVDDYTDALGHTEVTDAGIDPTCTSVGYSEGRHCSVCNTILVMQEELPMLPHEFTDWSIDKAPTCTEMGVQSRNCKNCDHSETVDIIKLGHDMVVTVVAPTCTADGYTAHACSRCDYYYADEYIDMLGHDEIVLEAKDATCTEDGITEGLGCSRCDEIFISQEVLPAIGHDYAKTVHEVTCTEQGSTEYICLNCGDSYEEDIVEALGHSEVSIPKREPGCTDIGFDEGIYCSRCNKRLSGFDVIPATGHSYDEWITDSEPDCTEKGSKHRVCTVCGYEDNADIPELGHDYRNDITEPTCTEKGFVTHTCLACGDVYIDGYVDALGHKTEIFDFVAPTCTEEGYSGDEICTVCDEMITEGVVVPATGHSYVGVITEPTCTETGYTTYTCSVCGDEYIADETDALGHKTELRNAIAPTCTENGYSGDAVCTVCEETIEFGYETEALGHVETTAPGVEPTCTAIGYSDSIYCSVCNVTITSINIIPAKGHVKGVADAVAPTCTENGYDEYDVCIVCGTALSEPEVIPALGHIMGEWTVEEQVSCTENGLDKRVCSVCGSVETKVIEAPGHEYEAVVTAPTCTENGYTTYTCSVCGSSYVDVVTEATGHSYEPVVTAPTCIAQGYTTYTCSVCGDMYVDDYTDIGGHDYTVVVTAPSCISTGYTTFTCKICGDYYVGAETEKSDHDYSAVVTEPGCTVQGYTTYTCTVCGDSYVGDQTEPTGHNHEGIVTAATCTEKGYTTYTCTVCFDTYKADYTDVIDHTYIFTTTKPTCTEKGYAVNTCAICGYSYSEAYKDALGHTETILPAKAATCTEKGLTEGRVCTVCNEVTMEQKEIPAAGHDNIAVVTEPTCTENGYTTYTCSVCGEVTVDNETAAKGHDTELMNAKDATPQEDGYTGDLVCKVCGAMVEKGSIIPALKTVKGDVDGDGEVRVNDARLALRIAAKLETSTETQILAGDLDGDGNISISEARTILRVAAKLEKF